MNQDESGIFEFSSRSTASQNGSCAVITKWPWKPRLRTVRILIGVSMAVLGPQNIQAQQSLIVDINVFGVNTNQITATQQLTSACSAAGNETTAAAQDLQNTCQLISDLDQNNPDDVVRLQEILDIFAPEEAFSVNDSIVYVSDYQTTNVHVRINSLRSPPSKNDSDNTIDESEDTTDNGNDATGLFSQSRSLTGLYWSNGVAEPGFRATGSGAATDSSFSRLGVFFSGQLSSGNVDGSTFEQDADISSSSFTTIADYRFTDRVVAGLGLGVVQNETDFANVDGGTDSEGFNLTAFGSWYEESKGYIDVVLDLGQNSHDLERSIGTDPVAPVLAQSSTDSTAYTFTLSAGRYFAVRDWDMGGYVRLSLTDGTVDGYTERASNTNPGSGSVFSFGSQSIRSTKLAIGVEASRVISTSKAVLIPVVRIEYESENEDNKGDLTATLVTSQVSATYGGTDRDTAYTNLGLGGSAVFKNGKSAYAFYETHLQHDFVTQNWLKFGLRLEF